MNIGELFILIVFAIPIYGLLIWTYMDPEGSFFFGKRWMYEKEPELSEGAIKYYKTASIIAIIVLTIIILLNIFDR